MLSENIEADELAKVVVNNQPIPDGAFYQVLRAPTTQITPKAFKTVLVTEFKD